MARVRVVEFAHRVMGPTCSVIPAHSVVLGQCRRAP